MSEPMRCPFTGVRWNTPRARAAVLRALRAADVDGPAGWEDRLADDILERLRADEHLPGRRSLMVAASLKAYPSCPVPIPLPPEPPHDRVIEAVDADGQVRWSWVGNQGGNRWRCTQTGDLEHFEDIVYDVQSWSRYGPFDLTLRHVPAEEKP